MNNFELHEKAMLLAQTDSAYKIARELIKTQEKLKDVEEERNNLLSDLNEAG